MSRKRKEGKEEVRFFRFISTTDDLSSEKYPNFSLFKSGQLFEVDNKFRKLASTHMIMDFTSRYINTSKNK